MARSALLIIFVLFIISCKQAAINEVRRNVTPPDEFSSPIPKPAPDKDGKVDSLEQAKYDYEAAAAAQGRAKYRIAAIRELRAADTLEAQVTWITGIALLIAAVSVFCVFLVPVGKTYFLSAIAAGVAVAACAQVFREFAPYLIWVGVVIVVVGGITAAFMWRRLGTTVCASSDHGDRVEMYLRDDLYPLLDDNQKQKFNQLFKDAKDESKLQAERLGVHNPLQYLRGKKESLWKRFISKLG